MPITNVCFQAFVWVHLTFNGTCTHGQLQIWILAGCPNQQDRAHMLTIRVFVILRIEEYAFDRSPPTFVVTPTHQKII